MCFVPWDGMQCTTVTLIHLFVESSGCSHQCFVGFFFVFVFVSSFGVFCFCFFLFFFFSPDEKWGEFFFRKQKYCGSVEFIVFFTFFLLLIWCLAYIVCVCVSALMGGCMCSKIHVACGSFKPFCHLLSTHTTNDYRRLRKKDHIEKKKNKIKCELNENKISAWISATKSNVVVIKCSHLDCCYYDAVCGLCCGPLRQFDG